MGRRHSPEVHQRQRHGERAVDEGAVDEEVDVVESIAKDGYPYSDGDARCHDYDDRVRNPLVPAWRVYRDGDDEKNAADDKPPGSVGKPLQLLALYPYSPAQSYK